MYNPNLHNYKCEYHFVAGDENNLFSETFKNVYSDIEKNFNNKTYTNILDMKKRYTNDNVPDKNIKYGIKELLRTKNGVACTNQCQTSDSNLMMSPTQNSEKDKVIIDIDTEKNNFIDIDIMEDNTNKIINDTHNLINISKNTSNEVTKLVSVSKHLIDESEPINNKSLDIEINKKIDKKIHKNNLNDIDNKLYSNISNMDRNKMTTNKQEDVQKEQPKTELEPTKEQINNKVKETKDQTNLNDEKEYEWPILTVDDISVSFKVVGELPPNTKLKIVDGKNLAIDNSYIKAYTRYVHGQNRYMIISFLRHLLNETKRNSYILLNNAKNNVDVDTNINNLVCLIRKLDVFLHKFDKMREVYVYDSNVHAILGTIRDNFFTFQFTFYKDMIMPK